MQKMWMVRRTSVTHHKMARVKMSKLWKYRLGKNLSRHFRQKAPCQVNRDLAEKALVVVASAATQINYRFYK